MKFLIIVVAYLICHFSPWRELLHRDTWFGRCMQLFQDKKLGPVRLSWFWVVAPVFLLVMLLCWLHDSFLLLLVINLAVLMYAVGRGPWRVEIDTLVSSFAQGDTNLFKTRCENDDILMEGVDETQESDNKVATLWRNFVSQALYRELETYYAVFFWFFLLGAPAALFYRLLFFYVNYQEEQGLEVSLERRVLWGIEWLPVRLLTILFGVVGNFATLLKSFQLAVMNVHLSSGKVLAQCAEAALFVDEDEMADASTAANAPNTAERVDDAALQKKAFEKYHCYSVAVKDLLKRTEVAFLAFLSVLILLF